VVSVLGKEERIVGTFNRTLGVGYVYFGAELENVGIPAVRTVPLNDVLIAVDYDENDDPIGFEILIEKGKV
jgi:hypothetical protein